jgi:hypothetical protein
MQHSMWKLRYKIAVCSLVLICSGVLAQEFQQPSVCLVHKDGVEFIVGGNTRALSRQCTASKTHIKSVQSTQQTALNTSSMLPGALIPFTVNTTERQRIVRQELVEEQALFAALQNALSKDVSNAELRRKVEVRQSNVAALQAELKNIEAGR